MQPDMKIWKQALDMRGKQSKHMSAQDYMSNIQALTTQPLTEATIRIRGNKQSGRQGINDIKERYELSHVEKFLSVQS